MEREREEIGGERRTTSANQVRPRHPLAMGGAWASWGQRAPLAVGPTASLTARPSGLTAWVVFSRAPSVLQPVSWASELRFQIRFWIMNRDSLTHDENYTTLKNS